IHVEYCVAGSSCAGGRAACSVNPAGATSEADARAKGFRPINEFSGACEPPCEDVPLPPPDQCHMNPWYSSPPTGTHGPSATSQCLSYNSSTTISGTKVYKHSPSAA